MRYIRGPLLAASLSFVVICLLATGCSSIESSPTGSTDTPSQPWELSEFDIDIVDIDPAELPSQYHFGRRPVEVTARAAAQNISGTALEEVHLYVYLPENTAYVRGLGWAHEQRRRVAAGDEVSVEWHNRGSFDGNFKQEIPLDELAAHLEKTSTVVIEWLQDGSEHSLVLKPGLARQEP